MSDTITAKDLAAALEITKQAIMKRAKKEDWPHENGGNRVKRFVVSKLPEEIKMAVGGQRSEVSIYNRIAKTVPVNPASRAATPWQAVGSPELAEWQNRIALARADLIRAYLGEKDRAKKERASKVEAAKLYIKGYNTGQLMPQVFAIIGKTSFQSVETWVR
ncbi:MAG: hypothetical protein JRD68_09695, partial [Deltaproteobacteria bacterium]|nr:hypothetical protein [Deltaproteobacteria bacterium]